MEQSCRNGAARFPRWNSVPESGRRCVVLEVPWGGGKSMKKEEGREYEVGNTRGPSELSNPIPVCLGRVTKHLCADVGVSQPAAKERCGRTRGRQANLQVVCWECGTLVGNVEYEKEGE